MKIQLNRIGAIKQMDFVLKPGLTVFCGPNNTGKTWAAYAIFSILSNLRNTSLNWLSDDDYAQLDFAGMVEIDFSALTHSQAFLDQVSTLFSNQLASDFDAPQTMFAADCIRVDNIFQSTKRNEPGISTSNIGEIREASTWKMGDLIFKVELAELDQKQKLTISLLKHGVANVENRVNKSFVVDTFNKIISELIADSMVSRPFVLTAERAAISLFSKELAASRSGFTTLTVPTRMTSHLPNRGAIGGARGGVGTEPLHAAPHEADPSSFIIRPHVQNIRYPLPIRISLGIAEDLANISKNPDPANEYHEYARALEQEMLGGEIEVGEYGEISYTPASATNLRIHLTASMIKSLASLVVYLRYQAKKGDVLIIDEPELNLHPVNQRKIARFLCKLVNAEIDIIISTHSDYIIREINNAILLKDAKLEEIRKKYQYAPNELLAPDLVTVVMFDSSGMPKREELNELGFAVDSIDDEINLLNQIADDILWELEK